MDKKFLKRKKRVRAKISGTDKRPRVVVFRSNKYAYVQAIDDIKGITLAQSSHFDFGKIDFLGVKGLSVYEQIGEKLAEKLLKKKIKEVVFDKSGYKYHGKVRALAEGIRKGGIKF